MKKFNITGKCYPNKHYMVDISHTVDDMVNMVEEGEYFTINRGRQYGKTTTISMLKARLEGLGYSVYSISFEGMGDEDFVTSDSFYKAFLGLLYSSAKSNMDVDKESGIFGDPQSIAMTSISSTGIDSYISDLCGDTNNKTVLIIDEVDQAGNYDAFITFLGLLRKKFLTREEIPTFHSVVLSGVYDIKNLKLKVRGEDEQHYNSPWNIALNYDGDMSFSVSGIKGMLDEYEADHNTGMDTNMISQLLEEYTSGYPYLVSYLCRKIDESFSKEEKAWSVTAVKDAVKVLLKERNTLFDDIIKKMDQYPGLKKLLYEILYEGTKRSFNAYEKSIEVASMFGFVCEKDGFVAVSNRIFEMFLYNWFSAEHEAGSDEIMKSASVEKNQYIKDGSLDMKKVIERFIIHYNDIYGNRDDRFHEKEGRKYFLFYLKPIINGTGNAYVEAETRDETRTDVIIDYLGKQFIIELKIWRGNSYNERGEKQLLEYMDYYHTDTGYMLSFCFNKDKQRGVHTVSIGNKTIIEGVV